MAIYPIITDGFGSYGSIADVIREGYSSAEPTGGRTGRGRVTPRMFGWPRLTSQTTGNTQRLTGGTQ